MHSSYYEKTCLSFLTECEEKSQGVQALAGSLLRPSGPWLTAVKNPKLCVLPSRASNAEKAAIFFNALDQEGQNAWSAALQPSLCTQGPEREERRS